MKTSLWLLAVLSVASVCLLSGQAGAGGPPPSTARMSVAGDGSQVDATSYGGAVSGDGRYVLFSSSGTGFVPGDTNGDDDAFVRDSVTGTTEQVALDASGNEANGNSSSHAISSDGRYVAFASDAPNLVADDTNGVHDVFVRDRVAGTTERISVDSSGNEGDAMSCCGAEISADGRYVVFPSEATNLVADDTNLGTDIFLHDRLTAETSRVSLDSSGNEHPGSSEWDTAVSDDGRYVVIMTHAPLVFEDTNNELDIYVRDRVEATTERVSVASDGTQSSGGSNWGPSISDDGRFVSFVSYANNLVPGVSPTCNGLATACGNVYVHDLSTGITEIVSVSSTGVIGDSQSCCGAISGDGRYVTYYSHATNLVVGDAFSCAGHAVRCPDAFVHDRLTGITALVTVAPDGGPADGSTWGTAINDNGRYVVFLSFGSNFVSGDTNVCGTDQPTCMDVFLRDLGDSDGDGEWDPFDHNTDTDGDLAMNPAESRCGSNPYNATSVPERLDTPTDDDGDTLVNENLPLGTAAYDCDGDGYVGTTEGNVATSDQDPCGGNGWPSDLVAGGFQPNALNVQDLGSFTVPVRRFGTSPPHPNFDARWDLAPGGTIGGRINLSDVAATITGASGYPPMLGGLRAFGKACPWAP